MRRLRAALAGALLLAGCAALGPIGPQIPGRRGLELALSHFESVAAWRNWPALLETFYLPDHAAEVRRVYGGDAARWFRAVPLGAALAGGEVGEARHICAVAFRPKRVGPRFHPHFVVYYRVRKRPCQEGDPALGAPLAEGSMEWGYDPGGRRWVHLRPLK